jgi:hypothetical protein
MIIGLSGYAGAGKNTACDIIRANWSGPFVEESFAARLKLSAVRNWFPDITVDRALSFCDSLKNIGRVTITFEDSLYPPVSVTGREFLQHYGTEAHRHVFSQDFWVEQVMSEYDSYNADALFVITDCRFPNEAEAVLRAKGEVWRINRDSAKGVGMAHASEKPLDNALVTREIDNNTSIANLNDHIIEALADLPAHKLPVNL